MFKVFKRHSNKTRFCGTQYIIEPKYKLFYVSKDGKDILTCKVPKKVIEIKMHRPHGKDIYGANVINLGVGDVFKITVHNFDITPQMSILEKTVANTISYIRYNGDGRFEELKRVAIEQEDHRSYITIYKAY